MNKYIIIAYNLNFIKWLIENLKIGDSGPSEMESFHFSEILKMTDISEKKSIFSYIKKGNRQINKQELHNFIKLTQNNFRKVYFILRESIIEWHFSGKPETSDFFSHYLEIIKIILESDIQIIRFEDILQQKHYMPYNLKIINSNIKDVHFSIYQNKTLDLNSNNNPLNEKLFTRDELNELMECQYLKEVNYYLTYPHYFIKPEKRKFIKKILRKIINYI